MLDSRYLERIIKVIDKNTDAIAEEKELLIECKDIITNWTKERQKIAQKYVKILNLDKEEIGLIAEIGKGSLDSLVMTIKDNTPYDAVTITPYTHTFDKEVDAFDPRMLSDSECIELNNKIQTVMLQLPCSVNELKAILSLADSNKTVYIGAYGLSDDKDKEENLKIIKDLYDIMKVKSQRQVALYKVEEDGYYYSAVEVYSPVKNKYRYKEHEIENKKYPTLKKEYIKKYENTKEEQIEEEKIIKFPSGKENIEKIDFPTEKKPRVLKLYR